MQETNQVIVQLRDNTTGQVWTETFSADERKKAQAYCMRWNSKRNNGRYHAFVVKAK